MVNAIIEIAGLIGILIISGSGITQLYKAVKTHSVKDLSLSFFVLILILFHIILFHNFQDKILFLNNFNFPCTGNRFSFNLENLFLFQYDALNL